MDIKKLYLEKIVWYKWVECYIDVLSSGNVWKQGSAQIRIVPKSGVTERTNDEHSKVIIQHDGRWLFVNNEHLSFTAPPKKIVWRKTKSNVIGNYDINMYKKLITLLVEGKTLVLKFDTVEEIKVKMDSKENITHEPFIETTKVLDAMVIKKDYFDWYELT